MFYAEFDSRKGTEFVKGYGDVETGTVDLWRFSTKKERDNFVNTNDCASVISSKDAKKQHKEQWRYWNR